MKNRVELERQTKPILTDIVKELVLRDYGRIITQSMIDWHNRSFLTEILIDFNIQYLSGAIGITDAGSAIRPNDMNDLFMTIYVDRHSYYHTRERFWRTLCLNNPILKTRFILGN